MTARPRTDPSHLDESYAQALALCRYAVVTPKIPAPTTATSTRTGWS